MCTMKKCPGRAPQLMGADTIKDCDSAAEELVRKGSREVLVIFAESGLLGMDIQMLLNSYREEGKEQ